MDDLEKKKKKSEEIDIQAKLKYVQDTQYVIGGKWKLPIIISIYYDNIRFNEIKKSIPNITNRVLSKELKHLEENFLINRSVYDDYPARVEYTLTEYCYTLTDLLKLMEDWGKQHRDKIKSE